jgi:hypothetical protein
MWVDKLHLKRRTPGELAIRSRVNFFIDGKVQIYAEQPNSSGIKLSTFMKRHPVFPFDSCTAFTLGIFFIIE